MCARCSTEWVIEGALGASPHRRPRADVGTSTEWVIDDCAIGLDLIKIKYV